MQYIASAVHSHPNPSVLRSTFAFLDGHRALHLEGLVEYLRIPSLSITGEGIQETVQHIAGLLADVGFDVEVCETGGWPAVIARIDAGSDLPTALFYGHYDVQPTGSLGEWASPPFTPSVRDGRIFARGAGDNKGQHLANIYGIAALRRVAGRLPCNVIVLLDGEEEIGSPHLESFVASNRQKLQADATVISDGPTLPSGVPCISFGVRGVLCIELVAEGAKGDLHSGHWGGIAREPLWELVHVLASMRDDHGNIVVAGLHDAVRQLHDGEVRAFTTLPVDLDDVKRELELPSLEVQNGLEFWTRIGAQPSLTINGLHGGYDGPGTKTVLPHRASAKCDLRLVADQTCDGVFDAIAAHVAKVGRGVKVIRLSGSMEPSRTELDAPVAQQVRRAIVTAQGAEPALIPVSGGSLPSYVFKRELDCPTLIVPYANADEANHASNENLELDRFFAGIKTGAAIAWHLGAPA